MKKFAIMVLCFLTLCACASKEEPLAYPIPESKPLYGVTHKGVFFIHDSLVQNAEVESVKLASQATEWKQRTMEKVGDYHVYDCSKNRDDWAVFVFYRNYFKIQYAFHVNRHLSIPEIFEGNKEVIMRLDPADLVKIARGHVFYTTVLDEDPPIW